MIEQWTPWGENNKKVLQKKNDVSVVPFHHIRTDNRTRYWTDVWMLFLKGQKIMAETPEAISASDQSIIFFAVAKAVCAKFLIRDSCIKSGSEKNTKCMRVKLDLPRVQTKTENFFRHIFAGRTEKIQHSLTQEEKDKNGFFFLSPFQSTARLDRAHGNCCYPPFLI